ncbi:MAG: hypothetical protein AAGA17_07440 [Actinomycetota bacterium]
MGGQEVDRAGDRRVLLGTHGDEHLRHAQGGEDALPRFVRRTPAGVGPLIGRCGTHQGGVVDPRAKRLDHRPVGVVEAPGELEVDDGVRSSPEPGDRCVELRVPVLTRRLAHVHVHALMLRCSGRSTPRAKVTDLRRPLRG